MEQTLLKDIPQEKDYPIAHMLRISDLELKDTKNGKQYLSMTLSDSSTGFKYCKKWDSDQEMYARFKKARVVFVTGKTDVYKESLSIVCETIALPEEGTEADFLATLLPTTTYDIKYLKKEVWGYVTRMENEYIKKVTQLMVTDDFVKSRLSAVPAGLSVHHSYMGGLLVHIYRLLVIGDALVDAVNNNPYPGENPVKVNKDIVMFGLICHDIFKTYEYSPELTYEQNGNLVNHLPMGAIEVNRKMDQIEDFPEELRKQLTHVLLSHHGKVDWGSPVTPKTLEANIVHYLDVMMSRVDPMLEALQDLDADENWTGYLKSLGGPAYRGGSLI
jgi:3'-5' exoribonuclease